MKKNVSRILSVILAICMVVSLMPGVRAVESDDTVEILFLDTSDIHGQLYTTDYTADASASGTYRQGLTRVASYVKEMREQYANVFLADTGDTIQGTPLTYYYAFEEDTLADPTVKAMRTMGYDMWVLGNHEFNYGMKILTEQVDYAISASTESEKQITTTWPPRPTPMRARTGPPGAASSPTSSRSTTVSRSPSWAWATPASPCGTCPRTGPVCTSPTPSRPMTTTRPRCWRRLT